MLNRIIRYFLENRVVTLLLLVLIIVWGISTSPFNWHGGDHSPESDSGRRHPRYRR